MTRPGRLESARRMRPTEQCLARIFRFAGASRRPITLGIYKYIGNNNQEWNAIMATAVVASVPAAVLLVLAQRYVAAGVTAGAVKD